MPSSFGEPSVEEERMFPVRCGPLRNRNLGTNVGGETAVWNAEGYVEAVYTNATIFFWYVPYIVRGYVGWCAC